MRTIVGRPPKEENSMKRKNVVQEGFSEFIRIVLIFWGMIGVLL